MGEARDPLADPTTTVESQPSAPPAAVTAPSAVPTPGGPPPEPSAATGVPLTRVAAQGGGNGARWGIALLITAAVLGVASIGLILLSSGSTTSSLVGYVPAQSYGYLEIRLDAPGDQRQNAANVLSKFPGFADQATLGTKIDEALDQLLGRAMPSAGTFSRDIRPWLGDSVALVATRLPDAAALSDDAAGGLLMIHTKDPDAARAYVRSFVTPGAATTTIGGVELSVVEGDGASVLVGVVDTVLLAGDEVSVRAAIETRGASTFGEGAAFREATAAASGDRLAFGFLDLRRVTAAALSGAGQAPPANGLLSPESLPSWLAFAVRAESDAMAVTLEVPTGALAPTDANHASVLASDLPAGTLLTIELHDLGSALLAGLGAIRDSPDGAPVAEQLDRALQALGGAESLVGWIGDGSVALVSNAGGMPDAGILIRAKSVEQAAERLVQLRNLVSLAGASAGVEIRQETYAGASITIYDLGTGLVDPDAADLPINLGDSLQVAVAQREELVVVGVGTPFVRAVLDAAAGESLAEQRRYRVALERAGASNAASIYVDLRRLIDLAVVAMRPDDQEFYRREVEPYLEPLQAFAASVSAGERSRARVVVTVE